ncbi:hypothetical protein KAK06_15310 [Ideonella sp. 4Y11]|uniref:Uncharacterized protein n=1 Tax=Ideonella aquatica TaxID=2824119 RepID=A0A940YNW0_9BURK|nr:hypothetical protein [Ideonella aquatica]MBQ0960322.1 hypothetical protein [Ideonella aquatica]
MKRIFVPAGSGTDWRRLLAQPKPMTTAASWEGADGALPPEIATVLHRAQAATLAHAFDSPSDRRGDFERFALELGAQRMDPNVFWVPGFDKPAHCLVWCDGDPACRQVQWPSAL